LHQTLQLTTDKILEEKKMEKGKRRGGESLPQQINRTAVQDGLPLAVLEGLLLVVILRCGPALQVQG
jgi:hypothetical protein